MSHCLCHIHEPDVTPIQMHNIPTDLPDLADMPYEIRKWMLEYHVLQQQKTRVKHAIEKLLESSGRGTTPET